MNFFEMIVLAMIQGITEWLPVSSEAQTMLYMLNYLSMDPGKALSLAFFLHTGSMLAVIVRFRNEITAIVTHLRSDYALTRTLFIASLATAFSGIPLYMLLKYVLITFDGTLFTLLIGIMLVLTGLLLKSTGTQGTKTLEDTTDMDMVLVGLAQGCAIIPGISRSGMTITTLLARKINQETAMTLSFLLSVPAVLGALLLDFSDISAVDPVSAVLLTGITLVVGYVSMDLLLQLARSITFWKFCIALGALSIGFVLISVGL